MNSTEKIKQNADFVNKFLKNQLNKEPKSLYQAASHLIIHGGKRLRPYMVIQCNQLLGGKRSDAIRAACAIEMVHNFTLVHDDIMDNDEARHGVPTTHNIFGMPVAILAGDVLFSKAYEVISNQSLQPKIISKLVSKLAKACVDVCEGQILDISMAEQKRIPSRQEYIKMIEKKTSALFEVSCAMGVICANGSKQDIKNLSAFGKNLGVAFQITDDLIGVMGDPKITKKPVGNDLREGKKSLPILLAIKKAKGRDKRIILRAFGNSNAKKEEIKTAVNTIRSLGIEEIVRREALEYAEKAKRSLQKYSGPQKKDLISLLDFVVKRSL